MNDKKKTKIITILCSVVVIACIGITIYFVIKANRTLEPDYAPGVLDPNAVRIPDSGEKLSASKGGGAVELSYSNKSTVNLAKKKVFVNFNNPSKSTKKMILQVIVTKNEKDIIIAQSEGLPAGYAIYELDLIDTVKLAKGGYNGKFNILFYDSETNEKAIVNTNIPIKIAVE